MFIFMFWVWIRFWVWFWVSVSPPILIFNIYWYRQYLALVALYNLLYIILLLLWTHQQIQEWNNHFLCNHIPFYIIIIYMVFYVQCTTYSVRRTQCNTNAIQYNTIRWVHYNQSIGANCMSYIKQWTPIYNTPTFHTRNSLFLKIS